MTNIDDNAYARLKCPLCGLQLLTHAEYNAQMRAPDALWECPRCKRTAYFDDEYWETEGGGREP